MKVVFEDGHFKYVNDNNNRPLFDRLKKTVDLFVLRRSQSYKDLMDGIDKRKIPNNKINNNVNRSSNNVVKQAADTVNKKINDSKKQKTSTVTDAQKTPTVTIPESFADVTLDQARAELNDYYSNLGQTKDVSKMSDQEVVDEFIKYLNYQNSKLTDDYYKENPIQQQQPVVTPKYGNVDLTRGDVRNVMRLYGYNPYADFTASQRRAIRKRAAGDTTQDMEWLKNYDHKLNNESLYDFFVTYRKKGGLISNNVVKRFKMQYNPFRVR